MHFGQIKPLFSVQNRHSETPSPPPPEAPRLGFRILSDLPPGPKPLPHLVAVTQTVTKPVRFDYTFKKQSGGAGQYAKIIGYMEPIPEGSKETFEFQNKTVGQNLTSGFVSATKKVVARTSSSRALCPLYPPPPPPQGRG